MQGERSMVVLGLRLMDNFQTKKKKKTAVKFPHTQRFFGWKYWASLRLSAPTVPRANYAEKNSLNALQTTGWSYRVIFIRNKMRCWQGWNRDKNSPIIFTCVLRFNPAASTLIARSKKMHSFLSQISYKPVHFNNPRKRCMWKSVSL